MQSQLAGELGVEGDAEDTPLRGADHALKQCVTLLRQTDQAVPEGVEDALSLVEDAISSLES